MLHDALPPCSGGEQRVKSVVHWRRPSKERLLHNLRAAIPSVTMSQKKVTQITEAGFLGNLRHETRPLSLLQDFGLFPRRVLLVRAHPSCTDRVREHAERCT